MQTSQIDKPVTFNEFISKTKALIDSSEGAVQGNEMEKTFPTKHAFSGGLYVRQMKIKKGHALIGKIHKHDHPNFIMSGKIKVFSEQFGEQIIKGPCHFISRAGTQRLGIAIRDTIWVTVHANPENITDLEKLEDELVVCTPEEYSEFLKISGKKQGAIDEKIS